MSCCPKNIPQDADHCATSGHKIDPLLYGSLAVITGAILFYLAAPSVPYIDDFARALIDLLKTMWWGIVLGIVAVGAMQSIPREYFSALMGRGDTAGGLLRAAAAGLLLDLCSHGILMVGAKLYERGASLAQVMTFLIASPWNSLTLTLILISLIGLPWTLVFIAGSAVIALLTGYLYMVLTRRGVFAPNPHSVDLPQGFSIRADFRERMKSFRFTPRMVADTVVVGWKDGQMVLRWLFFGTILAALIRTFVSTEIMTDYFGPTLMGLALTLLATTVIEVCSEGSTPIAAELFTRAAAPGNAFAFLMAGVSTDYTEMLVIREFSKSWKVALSLPLLTVPQILLLGWVMNMAGGG